MTDDELPLPGTEEQASLLSEEEAAPDWQDHWKGLPEYKHRKEEPAQSVLVHFKSVADREDFARVVGQRITGSTKSIWHPKAEIGTAADKVWTGAKGNPKYPVYIISKGRWESRLTSKAFEFIGVPYHIVVEPQEYDNYAAVIDPKKIHTLPFSNLGLGGIPARNWVWEHSESIGAERHWIFDDNISGFCRFYDNLKVEVDSGILLKLIEEWCDRYENMQMAAFNYDYFAPRKQGARIKPITLNTRCYSGILLKNGLKDADGSPLRWRGRYNEDTDLSLRILGHNLDVAHNYRGDWCTALFNGFLMYKAPTLTMKGGNTDELYEGAEAMAKAWEDHAAGCAQCRACTDGYPSKAGGLEHPCHTGCEILEKDGRWRMAEALRAQQPDVTTVERKWRRWQHLVDYRKFADNELVLKPGIVIDEAADHGFELAPMPPDEAGPEPATPLPPPRPEAKAVRPPVSAPAAAPAGPSALDFAATEAPPMVRPEQPAGPSAPEASLASLVRPASAPQASPERPAAEPTPAQMLRDALAAKGHRLLTKDGKFFVSRASELSDDERAQIKALRAELLLLAEVPISDGPVEQAPLYQQAPPPAAIEFVGLGQTKQEADWRPDQFPDLTGIDTVILNFATTGLNWAKGDRPVGLTVRTLDGKLSRFLPFAFQHGGNHDEAAVKRWAQEQLRNKKIVNAKTKFDMHQAREWGVDLEAQGCTFSDIQHTVALLDDHRKRFALDVLADEYLPNLPKVERVDESQHSNHHASEVAEREHFTAMLVGELTRLLQPQIDAQELREIHDLEDAVIPVVVEMEKNGAPIDEELLEQYAKECNAKHDELMWEIARECGFGFTHDATGWTRLIGQLGLTMPDAFDEAALSQIDHPLVRKGQQASRYASLNSKTFKAYREQIHNGILRYEINQLRGDDGGTVSGRLSIGYIQQVPNHANHHEAFGEGGFEGVDACDGVCPLFPRRLFTGGDGFDYMAADAAQIEYRLGAHYANNAEIIAAYKTDPWLSFHKMTWNRMKAYKPDMLYPHQKSFNFARQYGAKSVKLAVMMKFITAKEGEEIRRNKRWDDPRLATIHEIEAAYNKMMPEGDILLARAAHLFKPACDDYCNQRDQFHRERLPHRGFVKTLRGRRARNPDGYRSYIALNRVLQGTGADIMKKKMVELHRERKHTGFMMRLTAHDELGGDKRLPESLDRVMEILNVQSYPELRVPILWEGKSGKTWADCK